MTALPRQLGNTAGWILGIAAGQSLAFADASAIAFDYSLSSSAGAPASYVHNELLIWNIRVEWKLKFEQVLIHAQGPSGAVQLEARDDLAWLNDDDYKFQRGFMNDTFSMPLPLPPLIDRTYTLGGGAAVFDLNLLYHAELPQNLPYPVELIVGTTGLAPFEFDGQIYTPTMITVNGYAIVRTVLPSPGFAACAMFAAPMMLVRRRRAR